VCGRFTSSQRREAIGERFEVAVPETYTHRFNLAPQQRTLIIRDRDDAREAVMAKSPARRDRFVSRAVRASRL
jgi:putative SOS response-associated peptidase YedK